MTQGPPKTSHPPDQPTTLTYATGTTPHRPGAGGALIHVAFGRADGAPTKLLHHLATPLGWFVLMVVASAIFFGAAAGILHLIIGLGATPGTWGPGAPSPAPPLLAFTPLLWIFTLFTLAIMMRRLRRQRVRIILTYVEQAIRLNQPLASSLEVAARAERRFIRWRLRSLWWYLEQGQTLSRALWLAVPEVPAPTIQAIEAAEMVGRLPQELPRLMRNTYRQPESRIDAAILQRAYPLALFLIIGSPILGFVFIFIIPKFREIFNDFRTSLPPLTEKVIAFADWFAYDWGWLLISLPMTILLLAIVTRTFREIFRVRRGWWLLLPLIDRLKWYTPVAHQLALHRGLADVCTFLGDSLAAGTPLPQALSAATLLPANSVLARRIARWYERLMAGQPLADAAASARLPRLLQEMLATAESLGNVPQALNFLGRYYRWRFSRTAILLQAAVVPVTVLVLGSLVGIVVIAIMLPLVSLINAVMGTSPELF